VRTFTPSCRTREHEPGPCSFWCTPACNSCQEGQAHMLSVFAQAAQSHTAKPICALLQVFCSHGVTMSHGRRRGASPCGGCRALRRTHRVGGLVHGQAAAEAWALGHGARARRRRGGPSWAEPHGRRPTSASHSYFWHNASRTEMLHSRARGKWQPRVAAFPPSASSMHSCDDFHVRDVQLRYLSFCHVGFALLLHSYSKARGGIGGHSWFLRPRAPVT
jgi:hypothetical protein